MMRLAAGAPLLRIAKPVLLLQGSSPRALGTAVRDQDALDTSLGWFSSKAGVKFPRKPLGSEGRHLQWALWPSAVVPAGPLARMGRL